MSRSLYLTQPRYLAALKRQRERIAADLKLSAEDDDTPSNKSTSCSWGLCSDERAAWPDAEDHLWPEQFEKHGRVAPLYRTRGDKQRCPLNGDRPGEMNGCFFRCRVFNPRRGGRHTPDRVEAVALYDSYIVEAECR